MSEGELGMLVMAAIIMVSLSLIFYMQVML